jgi:hypothetical protein
MPNPMNQSRFQELVRKGWDKVTAEVTQELHQEETLKDSLYSPQGSDSAYFEKYGVSGLPDIPRFNGTLTYVDVAPGFGVRIEPAEFAAAVELERKLWLNNLYSVMKDWPREFMVASHRTKEKAAIKGYAKLNSAAFDFMPWNEEGVPIASSSHTTKNDYVTPSAGGFSNLGSSAFNPTSVEATRILMRGFRGLNGEILAIHPDGFIGPTTLDQKFEELTQTPKGLYSANGTINTQNRRKWDYKTSQYFNDYSTKSWIMVDWGLLKKLAIWITRMEDEGGAKIDFETYRLKFSLYSYWGYGFLGWQAFYFHQVT